MIDVGGEKVGVMMGWERDISKSLISFARVQRGMSERVSVKCRKQLTSSVLDTRTPLLV
jgi:hypothetical protein